MKYISVFACLMMFLTLQLGVTSCNSPSSTSVLPGSWEYLGSFDGYPRSGAVSFVINGIAYVGGGYNFDALQQGISLTGRLPDFWMYNPTTGQWKQMADFPGTARSQAVAFALNGKGYVGTGWDGSSDLSDFYQFDPTNGPKGTWTKIADFGFTSDQGATTVSKRHGALGFTVNDGTKDRAFVGAGHYVGDLKDLWEYDPIQNVWIQQPSIGGSKRQNAFVMVINNIAYVGGGLVNNATYENSFYKFDVTQLDGTPWTKLNFFTGKDANGNAITQPRPRESASTFTIDGKGYLMCGNTPGAVGDIWQYDPSTDTWIQYFSFTSNGDPRSGTSRSGAVAFALTTSNGTYGYLTTGGSSATTKFDDFWKFNPSGVEPDNK